MTTPKTKAFTLIELLVVIAVIGLLSAIITVSLKGSRDKAESAKIGQYGAQVYHAIGSHSIGVWNLNEGSGTSARDLSGNGITGNIVGPVWSSDVSVGQGSSLLFDGNDYVDIVGVKAFPASNGWTLEAMVKPVNFTTEQVYICSNSGCLGQTTSGGLIGWWRQTTGGMSANTSNAGTLTLGKWNHVTFSWSGPSLNKLSLKINGEEVRSNVIDPSSVAYPVDIPSTNWRIGSSPHTSPRYFTGNIEYVRIYEAAID